MTKKEIYYYLNYLIPKSNSTIQFRASSEFGYCVKILFYSIKWQWKFERECHSVVLLKVANNSIMAFPQVSKQARAIRRTMAGFLHHTVIFNVWRGGYATSPTSVGGIFPAFCNTIVLLFCYLKTKSSYNFVGRSRKIRHRRCVYIKV